MGILGILSMYTISLGFDFVKVQERFRFTENRARKNPATWIAEGSLCQLRRASEAGLRA